jgi:hypothetical protein
MKSGPTSIKRLTSALAAAVAKNAVRTDAMADCSSIGKAESRKRGPVIASSSVVNRVMPEGAAKQAAKEIAKEAAEKHEGCPRFSAVGR